jgi:hypothetical protein
VELAWRTLLYQPNYYLVQKWRAMLLNPEAHARARKRAIIAFARQLLICGAGRRVDARPNNWAG